MAEILFAGGCHVEGWPIGPEHSFVNVALGLIHPEEPLHPHIISYVNFKSASDRIAEACRKTGAEYVVLQLGHYETAPWFSKIFSRLLRSSTHKKHTLDVPFADGGSEQQYRPTFRIRLFNCRRIFLAAAFVALGARRKIFDPDRLFEELDSILTDLEPLHLKKVFLMSPFAVPDPIIRLCRRKAAEVFACLAQRHGCVYIDTFHLLDAYGKKAHWSGHYDRFHLNRRGQEKVGRLVASSIVEAIVEGGAVANTSRKSRADVPVHAATVARLAH